MSSRDALGLVGIIVAVAGIASPLVFKVYTDTKRFRANIRYRIEGFAYMAQLIAAQVIDIRTGAIQEISDDVRGAVVPALRDGVRDFLSAVPEDARWVDRHLRKIARGRPDDDPIGSWHLMLANLRIAVDRDLPTSRDVGGTIQQALGTAYISLIVLDLCRDEDEAVTWLRAATGGAQAGPGPASRVLVFAEGLLPERLLAQVPAATARANG